MSILFLFISYFFMGAGIKFADESFDGRLFNRTVGYFLMPLLIICGLWLIFTSELSATFFLAYLAAVIIGKKVDVSPFIVSLLVFLAFFAMALFYLGMPSIATIPFIIFFFSILFDELMNDVAEKKSKIFNLKLPKLFFYFFKYRMFTLLSTVIMIIFGLIAPSFILLFLGWYIGYSFIEITSSLTNISSRKKKA